MDRCRNGPGFHNDIDGNSTIQEILIPASKVGLVIGKGGETIKQLQVCEPLAEQRFNGPPGIGGKGLVLTQTTPPPGWLYSPRCRAPLAPSAPVVSTVLLDRRFVSGYCGRA